MSMYECTIAYRSAATRGNVDVMSRLSLPESPQVMPLSPEMILLMEELNTIPVTAERISVDKFRPPLFSCTSVCAEGLARFCTGCTTQAICSQQMCVVSARR